MTTTPNQQTLSYIRLQTRQRADRVIRGAPLVALPDPYVQSYVTSAELDGYLNESSTEVHDLLVMKFSSYFFVGEHFITTDGTNDKYPLPLNFSKLLSAQWVPNPDSGIPSAIVLKRVSQQEMYQYGNASLMLSSTPPTGGWVYCVFGDEIWFSPKPQGANTIRLSYIPLPTRMMDTASIQINTPAPGDTLTINGSIFTAIAHGGSPTGSQYAIGGTTTPDLGDPGTATSLCATLNAALGGKAGFLQAKVTANSTDTVQIILTKAATITWLASDMTTLLLTPDQVSGPTGLDANDLPLITWSNIFNERSGLVEYLIVDSAIKMLQKENDTEAVQTLMVQKEALIRRFEASYANRDAGSPKTVVRTRRGGWGGNGNGGWGGW